MTNIVHKIKYLFFQNNSEKQTVMKNTVWLTTSEILSRLVRFFLIIYVARILGADGWGLFSYTLSLLGIAMMFSDSGISYFFIKEHSIGSTRNLKTILILKLFLAFSSALLAIFVGFFFASLPVASLVIPIALILFSESLRDFLGNIFRVQEKMEYEAFIKLFTSITIVIASFIFLSFTKTPQALAFGYMTGSLLGLGITFILSFPFIRKIKEIINTPENNSFSFKVVFQFIFPITILGIATTAINNTDTIMLGIWTNAEQIGFYASAQRVLQTVLIIPLLFTTALFPTLSKMYTENKERFFQFAQKSLNILVLFSIPIAVGGFFTGTKIMTLLFGSAYTSGGIVFSLLITTALVLFPGILINNLAIITEQQKKVAMNTLVAIFVTVIANYLLIPWYGIVGAAIGTLFTQLFLLIKNGLLFKTVFRIPKRTLRDAFLGTCIVLASLFITQSLSIIISIGITGIIYCMFLLIIKNQEIFMVKNILFKKEI